MKQLAVWLGLAAVLVAVVAQTALAAKPTMTRIEIDDVAVPDPDLSAACGVPVTIDAVGHIIVRQMNGKTPHDVRTINIAITAHAGDNSYSFHDVGVDHFRVAPDGTEILMIVGQVPFDFIGVLKLNLTTGETILEPHHSLGDQLDDACAALTA